MMIKKATTLGNCTRNFAYKLVLITGLMSSSLALAGETVSVKDWTVKWAAKNKNAVSFSTAELEKNIFSGCSDCANKKVMETARAEFAKGQYEKAFESYNKVPKANTYWLNAVEERGWAQFRMGQFEKAMAQTKTLLAPQFAEVVNSEAYLLQSLSQLKICDYKGVFETHRMFKEKQKSRIVEIQNLSETGWNDAMTALMKTVDRFPMTLKDMGPTVQTLPGQIYKDVEFQKQALRFKATERALNLAENSSLLAQLESQNDQAFKALKKRVRQLAQIESDANFATVQKLNLVEVEAIQRVHTDTGMADSMYKKSDFKKTNNDQLVFMDDGRPWIDELDKYEVSAKTCVQGLRRKM